MGFGISARELTTLPHLSISAAIWEPNCSGVSTRGTVVNSVSRALIFGFVNPELISRLSFSTIAVGVPLGRRCRSKRPPRSRQEFLQQLALMRLGARPLSQPMGV